MYAEVIANPSGEIADLAGLAAVAHDALGAIRDGMIERGVQQIAVTPQVPDYLMLARAYRSKAVSATSLADFEQQLAAALKSGETTLIEVREQIVA